ncbi:uncharacterized protein LOC110833973 isoform X2 [Zootermopsis nevadensis]|uniref:Uncharacterized protein n=3 Tax=Zootermopsis nevadensis TaxID=136037 RepID=A0A067RIP6_ZOONE|nr:uncharacterized protein LOC110833973 isoform X2 [Zootermopsis nevadensis]KDR23721.1 hypothetical protein L798_13787 [Zootermopsis nevadensis]
METTPDRSGLWVLCVWLMLTMDQARWISVRHKLLQTADWWSLALLTHEMLSRATPFEAERENNQQMIFETPGYFCHTSCFSMTALSMMMKTILVWMLALSYQALSLTRLVALSRI